MKAIEKPSYFYLAVSSRTPGKTIRVLGVRSTRGKWIQLCMPFPSGRKRKAMSNTDTTTGNGGSGNGSSSSGTGDGSSGGSTTGTVSPYDAAVSQLETDDQNIVAAFQNFRQTIADLQSGGADPAIISRLSKVHDDLVAALAGS